MDIAYELLLQRILTLESEMQQVRDGVIVGKFTGVDKVDGLHAAQIGFVDRGTASAHDKVLADFTTDATWRDLDLSAIVPAGAKAILLQLLIQDDVANSAITLRKNGNTNGYNIGRVRTQVANIYNEADLIIPCDSNRIIEYYGSNVTFTAIYLTVKGWWQ